MLKVHAVDQDQGRQRRRDFPTAEAFRTDTNYHMYEACLLFEINESTFESYYVLCSLIFLEMCHISFSIIHSCLQYFPLSLYVSPVACDVCAFAIPTFPETDMHAWGKTLT